MCVNAWNWLPYAAGRSLAEVDYQNADIFVNVDSEKPSWWVWVKDEVELVNAEEWSGIDDENYIVIGDEHVVDGVANFMAKCILSNPKARVCCNLSRGADCRFYFLYLTLFLSFWLQNLSPDELRKSESLVKPFLYLLWVYFYILLNQMGGVKVLCPNPFCCMLYMKIIIYRIFYFVIIWSYLFSGNCFTKLWVYELKFPSKFAGWYNYYSYFLR